MSLTLRQCEHTTREALLVVYANAAGHLVKVDKWNRTIEEQKENIAKGVSKTMDSRHLDGLATDIYLVINGEAVYCDNGSPEEIKAIYRLLGTYWESRGGRWGGRFVDHAEFLTKNGRAFDPSKDLGWDPYHFETTLA